MPFSPSPKDRRLERSIEMAKLAVYAAQNPEESRKSLNWLRHLIDQRSPAMVREIERQKGLTEQ